MGRKTGYSKAICLANTYINYSLNRIIERNVIKGAL